MASRARALCTVQSVLLIITFATVVGVTLGAPAGDLIPSLPGQPTNVALKQYGGYVTVDEAHGRNLYYYFVESLTDSTTKPLVLWLNGGPGCSSLGGGGFSELGPFFPSKTGQGLVYNEYSWIAEANIIFLESPAGVGFSFSNDTADYSTSDEKTAQDALTFVLKWLDLYPEYKKRDFYITGESYAGHYIPQLATAILKNNKVASQPTIHLKGILVGNPLFDITVDLSYATVEYAFGHGMVSEETHDIIVKECKFSASVPENDACEEALDQAMVIESTVESSSSYIDAYDVLEDVCLGSTSQQALRLTKLNPRTTKLAAKLADTLPAVDPCIEEEETVYLNRKEVRSALHAIPTQWSMCSDFLNYNRTDLSTPMIPVLGELVKSGLQVWIFSGDADNVVPFLGTRKLISGLAKDLKLKTTSQGYLPWFQKQQVGGWSISWGSLSFATVRGAGHMVPQTQPPRALQLFASFLSGKELPKAPSSK